MSDGGYYLILSEKNDLVLHFNSKGELVNSSRKAINGTSMETEKVIAVTGKTSTYYTKTDAKTIKAVQKNLAVKDSRKEKHQKKHIQKITKMITRTFLVSYTEQFKKNMII
jgi:hypothetical protein